jgi:hypothetical protein
MSLRTSLIFCGLGLGLVQANPVVISEFMASNDGSLLDGDGESNDWIELHNTSREAVDLAGWQLGDSQEIWTLPPITLDGGDYLLVFASGRDESHYVDGEGFLHTTFRLSADGEALSLLRPDGSAASKFTLVPRQREGISFGLAPEKTNLVQSNSPSRFLISESPVSNNWRGGGVFNDSGWTGGAASLGFGGRDSNETTTAFLIPEGTSGNQNFGGSLGLDFIVIEPVLVTELGAFDSNGDGFSGTLTTQLWQRNDGGTPGTPDDDSGVAILASTTFSPANPGTLEGGTRFRTLESPLTLQPGSYSIVTSGFGVSDPNGNLGTPNAGDWESDDGEGALQFTGRGRFGTAGTFPANADGGPSNRYAAGNLKILPIADSEIVTDIGSVMRGSSSTVLERIEFDLNDPSAVEALEFRIAYDDGFTAWLNGVEVASDNLPVTISERDHRSYSIVELDGLLVQGTNLLAIGGRNLNAGDDDFLLSPSLFAITTDSASPRFFEEATPGFPNATQAFEGFVADTKFSVDRGFYTEPFEVIISTETPEAQIIFTTDGSEPSLGNGNIYDAPLSIGTTTVLRARAFRDGFRPTDIDTQSYLFPTDIARQSNTPAGYPLNWAGTSSRYGMTSSSTSYARAAGNPAFSSTEAEAAIKDSLASLPTLSIVTDRENLFNPTSGIYVNPRARGQAWERPVSVELIHSDGSPGFQENAGIRMMGFSSRNVDFRKLHMRLLFKNQYGSGTLQYPFFGEDRSDRINTIALRGNRRDAFVHTNNATYLGDEWAKRTQSDMGQLAPRGEFVHLYLNGLYWGVYNPTERPDDAFASEYLGGGREDYDVVKFCCPDRAVAGDINAWNQLLGEARNGIATISDYQRIQGQDDAQSPTLLDVDSLIDYLIAGQFHGAWDWPGNYYAIRDRDEGRTTGYRFFTWDNDVIFDGGNPAIANKVTPDPGHPWWTESPGEVDLGIRDNPEYRIRFADRVYQHYFNGGALSEEANIARWNDLATQVRPSLFAESARWGDANSALRTVQDHWDPMNSRMVNQYFPGRQAIVFNQLRNAGLYPQIAPPGFNRQGGQVAPAFGFAFTSGETIYYTTDGSDPRLPGGGIAPNATMATSGLAVLTLVQEDASTRALIPVDGNDGTSWTGLNYDDSNWPTGTGGVGYDNGADYNPIIGLDVRETMLGNNETAYIRISFPGTNAADFTNLTLKMRFDDGFIAYLNGIEVASANAPTGPMWNSRAIRSAEASTTEFDEFDISSFINLLRPDGNVLAIHGLNRGVSSADFVIQPVLEGTSTAGDVALELNATTEIKARAFSNNEWSALNQASFIVGTQASAENLVISEIFYNPPGPDEIGEFIELFNPTSTPVDISGVRFVAGINYEFPLNSVLAAGERIILSSDQYEGQLANGGEELILLAADDSVISSFSYDDRFPWPEAADGEGYSLVFFGSDPTDPASWRRSVSPGGTPEGSDSLPFTGGDLLAYALPDPKTEFNVTTNQWALQFTRPLNADEARYVVELSPDLETWTATGNLSDLGLPVDSGNTRVTYRGTLPAGVIKQFARIRVILARP